MYGPPIRTSPPLINWNLDMPWRKPKVGETSGTAPQVGYTPPTGGYIPPHGGYPYPYNQMTGGAGYNMGPGGYRQVNQQGAATNMPSQPFDPKNWTRPFKLRY